MLDLFIGIAFSVTLSILGIVYRKKIVRTLHWINSKVKKIFINLKNGQ